MASNKRILIVDDQQDLREQLAKLLSRSTKKNETVSLVRQMRSRLLGLGSAPAEQDSDDEPERGGYEVETASQGQEAFEKVRKSLEAGKPYAALFLDMRMPPGWDGLETAKRIREVDRLVEIVIMTAYADHDQETIAQSVGSPDKLLYIKKPFQSEEIFQLALCLTSKWSAEEDERHRKGWLEGLIRSMSKIKGSKTDKAGEICSSVLKALLTFMNSQKGFIASLSIADRKWKLEHASNIDQAEAASFISSNSGTLTESRTTQCVGGKYLLPLKREGYSAVAVIYDVTTPSDPEWYKLLSLLVMTASEVLSSASLQDDLHKGERLSAIGSACSKIAVDCGSRLRDAASKIPSLKAAVKDEASLKSLSEIESSISTVAKVMSKLSAFGDNSPIGALSGADLVALLQEVCAETKRERPESLNLSTEVSGIAQAQIQCVPASLKEAFKNIISNSVAAAVKASHQSLSVKIEVKPDGSVFRVSIEDDGPGVPDAVRHKIFEPFVHEHGADSLGLGLPIARQIFQKHGGSLFFDSQRLKGAKFTASLPASK